MGNYSGAGVSVSLPLEVEFYCGTINAFPALFRFRVEKNTTVYSKHLVFDFLFGEVRLSG